MHLKAEGSLYFLFSNCGYRWKKNWEEKREILWAVTFLSGWRRKQQEYCTLEHHRFAKTHRCFAFFQVVRPILPVSWRQPCRLRWVHAVGLFGRQQCLQLLSGASAFYGTDGDLEPHAGQDFFRRTDKATFSRARLTSAERRRGEDDILQKSQGKKETSFHESDEYQFSFMYMHCTACIRLKSVTSCDITLISVPKVRFTKGTNYPEL